MCQKDEVISMNEKQGKRRLICSMCIFGTIGILRRFIPYPSGFVAMVRGLVGTLFLLLTTVMRKQKIDTKAIRANLPTLILSGTAIGFNWIFLFEAYNYTSVATATLCYYLAPILVILASPLVLKEALTGRKLLCAAAALAGMVLVSGVLESGFSGVQDLKGIFFGLAAAALYATVMLLNKKLRDLNANDRTIAQLAFASLVMVPYVFLVEHPATFTYTPLPIALLLVAGMVHTGFAYRMYFGSMAALKAQTVALYSYIDPILAIVLSMVVLREPMTVLSGIGAVIILLSAYLSEK